MELKRKLALDVALTRVIECVDEKTGTITPPVELFTMVLEGMGRVRGWNPATIIDDFLSDKVLVAEGFILRVGSKAMLTPDGINCPLTDLGVVIMEELMKYKKTPVTSTKLLELLCLDDNLKGMHLLRNTISRIRANIADEVLNQPPLHEPKKRRQPIHIRNYRYIQTIQGVGYMLENQMFMKPASIENHCLYLQPQTLIS